MKKALIFGFLLVAGLSYGQTNPQKLSGISIQEHRPYQETDTIPKVVYANQIAKKTNLVVYLNGEKVDQQVLNAIDVNRIGELEVSKDMKGHDASLYDGVLYVTTKDGYKPKLISLNELQEKYLDKVKGPMVFRLNQKSLVADYDQKLLDEHFIMKVEVEEIRNDKEGLFFNSIHIITRTKENLEKANTIILRGDKT